MTIYTDEFLMEIMLLKRKVKESLTETQMEDKNIKDALYRLDQAREAFVRAWHGDY